MRSFFFMIWIVAVPYMPDPSYSSKFLERFGNRPSLTEQKENNYSKSFSSASERKKGNYLPEPPNSRLSFTKFSVSGAMDSDIFQRVNYPLDNVSKANLDWVDVDNDGDLDLIMAGTAQSVNEQGIIRIYRNDKTAENKNPKFTGIETITQHAQQYGLGADWGDFDLDGHLDLIFANTGKISLFLNKSNSKDGIQFSPKNLETTLELTAVNGATGWADYDQDGDLDVLLAGDRDTDIKNANNTTAILQNSAQTLNSTNFSLKGLAFGSANWGDYDADGDQDFVVSGVEGNTSHGPFASVIYENKNGVFTLAHQDQLQPVFLSTTEWGDFNNDGFLDLLLAGSSASEKKGDILKIYQYSDKSKKFEEVILEGATGTYTWGSESAQWGDVDNDGNLDVVAIERDGLVAYLNSGKENNYTFERHVLDGEVPYSDQNVVACGDYDQDRDLDLIITVKEITVVGGKEIGTRYTFIYENQINKHNKLPEPPKNLDQTVAGNNVTFKWDASGDETPPMGLSYDIIVYQKDQVGNIIYITPAVALKNGQRKLSKRGMINSSSYTLKNLKDGTYFWSVQAVDHGFAGSEFANEKSFTLGESPENKKPEIAKTNFKDIKLYDLSSQKSMELAVEASDDKGIVSAKVSYAGLSKDFDTNKKTKDLKSTTKDNYTTSFDFNELIALSDPLGIRYHFTFKDEAGKSVETTGVTYWVYKENEIDLSMADWEYVKEKENPEVSDYNLIALPYEPQLVTKALNMEAYKKEDLRLFRFIPGFDDETGFEEFTSNSFNISSKFDPRKGYALIMRNGDGVSLGGAVAEFNGKDSDGTPSHHIITLKPGWNLIGNPYPFSIDWTEVEAIGESGEDVDEKKLILHRMNNEKGYYEDNTSLAAYEGAFLYLDSGEISVKLYPSIKLDSKQNPGGRLSTAKPELSNGWELPLVVEHAGFEYSRNGIGMRKEASSGWDVYDGVQLPKLMEYAELLISANTQVPLNRSVVPEQNTYVWNAEVVGALAGEQVALRWNSTSVASLEHELFLWDETRGKLVAMKEQGQYSLVVADQGSTPLKIYYGSKEELLRTLGLDQPQIGALFPNPTEGVVKLPLLLPEVGAPFQLSMKIYNVQGQEISSFGRSELDAGYQELELNLPESLQGSLFHYSILLKSSDKLSTSLNGKILKR